jgi:hypothetical protein
MPSETRECYFEEDARRELGPLARRSAGVALYTVRGEPGSGLWRKPILLEKQGDVIELD